MHSPDIERDNNIYTREVYSRRGCHQASNFLGLETTRSGHLSSRMEYVDGERETFLSFSSDTDVPEKDFSDGETGKLSLNSVDIFTPKSNLTHNYSSKA